MKLTLTASVLPNILVADNLDSRSQKDRITNRRTIKKRSLKSRLNALSCDIMRNKGLPDLIPTCAPMHLNIY
jgi:hypothetical protein